MRGERLWVALVVVGSVLAAVGLAAWLYSLLAHHSPPEHPEPPAAPSVESWLDGGDPR